MNTNRMESFESSWAERHDIPAESLVQYRHATKDGYRLPDMAKHYRTWCLAIDAVYLEQEINDALKLIGYISKTSLKNTCGYTNQVFSARQTDTKDIPVFVKHATKHKAGE